MVDVVERKKLCWCLCLLRSLVATVRLFMKKRKRFGKKYNMLELWRIARYTEGKMKRRKGIACPATQQLLRWLLAGYVLLMLLGQLFTFEKFPGLISPVLGDGLAAGMAIALVLAELLALPFWLDMVVASWLRQLSRWAGGAALLLLAVVEWAAQQQGVSALFGATLELPSGGWLATLITALMVLALWAVWPVAKQSKK